MLSLIYILLLLLTFLLVILYFYLTRNFNYWKIKNIPHDKPTVIFGNMLNVLLGIEPIGKYLANLYNKFEGPYFGFYATDRPILVLKDPELIKRILIKDFHIFQDRLAYCDGHVDPITSYSLFGIKAPQWKPLRSKLSPVFTSGKIKMMLHLMKECGENLQNHAKNISHTNVNVKEIASKYTTDVTATCAFGIATNSFINENSEFRTAAKKVFVRSFFGNLQSLAYFFSPLLVKIFKFCFVPKEPVDFLRGIFNEAINQREIVQNKRHDLIDILIDLKNNETLNEKFKFDGDRLLAQVVIFLGAGHETTSSTISYTLHELCINTTIQNKVRKEIFDVIKKHEGITYEAVNEMKYLHMVISETLRKYPLTPFINRICLEDYKIAETGLLIEKGTQVMIPQHGLHWDAKYFPNPEKYDPERFNDENKRNITPYVYLPFSDGPRNCIGERFALMNIKLGIIYLMQNFKVKRNGYTKDPLIYTPARLLEAKGGLPMTFEQL